MPTIALSAAPMTVSAAGKLTRAQRRKMVYRHTVHYSATYFREALPEELPEASADGEAPRLVKGTFTSHVSFNDKATPEQVKGWGAQMHGDMIAQALGQLPELANCQVDSIMLLQFQWCKA